jgi:predicted alpha/beta-hydrolase family hydrolase
LNNPEILTVAVEAGATVTALAYHRHGPAVGASLILGHGAGAGQRSPFMVGFAEALAARGIDAVTFNFPYTEQKRRVPDRRPVLDACYAAVTAEIRRRLPSARKALFIGGKSMGGRIATHVAAADAALPISGLVLLGYPLHPPGRPAERRDAHLADVRRPMLIVQGSRDSFGRPAEFEPLLTALSPAPSLYVVEGGDHSFKVPRGGKSGQDAVDANIRSTVAEWIGRITEGLGAPSADATRSDSPRRSGRRSDAPG